MRNSVILFAIVVTLSSCTTFQSPKTLDSVRAGLDCVEYNEGIGWKQIHEKFGTPDIAPIPESGQDLSRNARVYEDKTIIFYTETREVKEGEKVRFNEVVTKIEVCKKK